MNEAVEKMLERYRRDTVNDWLSKRGARSCGRSPKGRVLKIKLEVDTDPPHGFATQTRYLLQPIPFAVRVYALLDLFAPEPGRS